jgi:hypothetical protein
VHDRQGLRLEACRPLQDGVGLRGVRDIVCQGTGLHLADRRLPTVEDIRLGQRFDRAEMFTAAPRKVVSPLIRQQVLWRGVSHERTAGAHSAGLEP